MPTAKCAEVAASSHALSNGPTTFGTILRMLLYLINLSLFMFRAGGACNGAKFEATGFGKASHSICLDMMFVLPSYVFTTLPCLSRVWPLGVAATDTTEFSPNISMASAWLEEIVDGMNRHVVGSRDGHFFRFVAMLRGHNCPCSTSQCRSDIPSNSLFSSCTSASEWSLKRSSG